MPNDCSGPLLKLEGDGANKDQSKLKSDLMYDMMTMSTGDFKNMVNSYNKFADTNHLPELKIEDGDPKTAFEGIKDIKDANGNVLIDVATMKTLTDLNAKAAKNGIDVGSLEIMEAAGMSGDETLMSKALNYMYEHSGGDDGKFKALVESYKDIAGKTGLHDVGIYYANDNSTVLYVSGNDFGDNPYVGIGVLFNRAAAKPNAASALNPINDVTSVVQVLNNGGLNMSPTDQQGCTTK